MFWVDTRIFEFQGWWYGAGRIAGSATPLSHIHVLRSINTSLYKKTARFTGRLKVSGCPLVFPRPLETRTIAAGAQLERVRLGYGIFCKRCDTGPIFSVHQILRYNPRAADYADIW